MARAVKASEQINGKRKFSTTSITKVVKPTKTKTKEIISVQAIDREMKSEYQKLNMPAPYPLYCCVPQCKNDESNTPKSMFISFPLQSDVRQNWLKAIFDETKDLVVKSNFKCCAAHFDVHNDLLNYMYVKMMGGKLKVRPGAIPHKFNCKEQHLNFGTTVKECQVTEVTAPKNCCVNVNLETAKKVSLLKTNDCRVKLIRCDVIQQRLNSDTAEIGETDILGKCDETELISLRKQLYDSLKCETLQSSLNLGNDSQKEVNQNELKSSKEKENGRVPVKPYRSCYVSMCRSTSLMTPDKLFFCAPRQNMNVRKKWLKAGRIANKSKKTHVYFCEDHFDLEKDMVNYMQWKLMGNGLKKIIPGVVPHKFDCWKPRGKATPRPAAEKRRKQEYMKKLLSPEIDPALIANHNIEFVNISVGTAETVSPDTIENSENETTQFHKEIQLQKKADIRNIKRLEKVSNEKSIQVHLKNHVRSRGTNTFIPLSKSGMAAIWRWKMRQMISKRCDDWEILSDTSTESMEFDYDCDSQIMTKSFIEKNPKLFLGVSKETFSFLKDPQSLLHLTEMEIMITLRKIRLNESEKILALHFGMMPGEIRSIFQRAVVTLADKFKEFIYFPVLSDDQDGEQNIRSMDLEPPIESSINGTNYVEMCKPFWEVKNEDMEHTDSMQHITTTYNGGSIKETINEQININADPNYDINMNCFAVKICKLVKARQVGLIKRYLICVNANGNITYISKGMPQNYHELTILRRSGLLNIIPPCKVASKGFRINRHAKRLLWERGCTLSKENDASCTNLTEFKHKIAKFKMISHKSTVDSKLIDSVVTIACGILNMENRQRKKEKH